MNDVFIGFLSALGKKNPIKNRFNGIKKFRKYNKKVQQ
ncbi:hypothetical protein PLEI_1826 [Photobacterium leiognathi lrivu.4.1]|uniref:Uncharacterized protein n=1 Tax=Photobacterium leiognathi lrivu.4.1 TaxID=1248232 RepID=A0A0U1P627_PHOLE|nr:hypothetical protein PLEI_1826 [Photobacterium leiognathi lrivu.4.1]